MEDGEEKWKQVAAFLDAPPSVRALPSSRAAVLRAQAEAAVTATADPVTLFASMLGQEVAPDE